MKNFLRVISILGDYILLVSALTVAIYVRTEPSLFKLVYAEYLRFFIPFFVFWISIFVLFDLYNFDVPPRFTRFFFCLMTCVSITAVIFYVFPFLVAITPKTVLGVFVAIFSLAYYFWRKLIEHIFVNFFHGHEIMMAVSDMDSLDLACILHNNPRYKYKVLGVLVFKDFVEQAHSRFPSELIYTDAIEFEKAIVASRVVTIVSTSKWFSRLYGNMYHLLPRNIRIINMVNFHERVLEYIPVHSTSQHWIMTNVDLVSRRVYMPIKRMLDLLLAVTLLPFVLLLMLVVAGGLLLFGERNASIFFKQNRVGLYNKEFMLYKFRTMRMDAEKGGKAVWATEKDPRITKIGNILRRSRLDELPQIFNVLKGEMSFIGPRPERMAFVVELVEKIPHYQLRHVIKPGLSGWAQVKYQYGGTVEEASIKLCYDLYYIKNINIFLDLRIFFKTIVTLVSIRGR